MKVTKITVGITYALTTLFLLSCSKKQGEKAHLNFQFQSKSQNSLNSKIDTLIVNIHHPDGRVQYKQCENACTQIQIETTTGPGKLIQVLAVVDGNASADVHYGDVLIDLQAGNNQIPVALAKKGSFSSEGRIQGLYIPQTGKMAGKYLTGELEMRVFVGQGKPAIKIQKNEIFGGLVNLFAVDSIPFLYYFTGLDETGTRYKNEPLFTDLHDGKGLTLNSAGVAANGQERVHFSSTKSYYEKDRDNTFVSRPKFYSILGSFGQNPTSRQLCAKVFSGLEELDGTSGKGRLCETVSSDECTQWLRWQDIQSSSTQLSGAVDSCSMSASEQVVNLASVTENYAPISLGFFGPFKTSPSEGLDFLLNFESGNLSWKIAEKVNLPYGLDLFIHPSAEDLDEDAIRAPNSDGILCNQLTKNGFQFVRNLDANAGSLSQTALGQVPANGQPLVALCLKKSASEYYKTALIPFNHEHHQGGSPSHLKISKAPAFDGFTGQTYDGVCTPLFIEALDNENHLASLEGSLTIRIDSTGGGGNEEFYQSLEDCQSNTDMTFAGSNYNVFEARSLIWLKSNTLGSYTLTAVETGGVGLQSGSYNLVNNAAPLPIDHLKMTTEFYRNPALEIATTEECVPFLISGRASNGELTHFGGGNTVDLHAVDDNNGNSISFYASKVDCQTSAAILTAPPLPAGNSIMKVYLKGSDLTAGHHIPVALSSASLSVEGSSFIAVVAPGGLDHYHVDSHGSTEAGACRRIKIGAYDDHKPNSYPVYFPGGESLSVTDTSSGDGHFYDSSIDPDHSSGFPCDFSTPGSESLSMSVLESDLNAGLAGKTSDIFYYQPITSGTSSELTIDFAGGDSQTLSVQNTQPSGAFLNISDGPLFQFPDQTGTTTPVHVFTITNLGLETTTVSSVQSSDLTLFTFNNYCTTLTPGATCNINVTMEDDGVDNVTYQGSLSIQYSTSHGAGTRMSHVNLKGRRLP